MKQGYKEMLANFPTPVVLNTYTCEGCKKVVKVTEMAISGGPDKGKIEKFFMGCKCEDIKLAVEVQENERKARMNYMMKRFNQSSLVNAALQKATFDNYQPTSPELNMAKQQMMSYVEFFDSEHAESILISGTYGTGKSHLSYSVAKGVIAKGHSALFLSVPKLLTKIKATYGKGSKFTEDELLDFIQAVDLLILDDMGAEYTNLQNSEDNWVTTKLFEIMDNRSGKHNIYTTNLSALQLEQKMGERNFDRIFPELTTIAMMGPSYRKRNLGGK